MKAKQPDTRAETIRIQVNGLPVTLLFSAEPNKEAADFIKKALINAYVVRTV